MRFKRSVIAGLLVLVVFIVGACGDSLGKRTNKGCEWKHSTVQSVNPYALEVNGEWLREVTCKNGEKFVIQQG